MIRNRPAINRLPFSIHKINISGTVDGSTRDVVETACKFFELRAFVDNLRLTFFRQLRLISRKIEPRKLTLPDDGVMILVMNSVVEGNFAIAVAVDITQPDVPGIRDTNCIRERLIAAHDSIHVHVGEKKIAGISNFERQGKAAFAALFFGLQRKDLPIGSAIEDRFATHVMFAGEFIPPAFGGSIGDVEARLCERAWCPNIHERAAASIRNPQARVLTVPSALQVRISSMRIVVNLAPDFAAVLCTSVRIDCSVPSQKSNIIHQGLASSHPSDSYCARIDSVCVDTDSGHD